MQNNKKKKKKYLREKKGVCESCQLFIACDYFRLGDDYPLLKNSFKEFLRDLICILSFVKTRFILVQDIASRSLKDGLH